MVWSLGDGKSKMKYKKYASFRFLSWHLVLNNISTLFVIHIKNKLLNFGKNKYIKTSFRKRNWGKVTVYTDFQSTSLLRTSLIFDFQTVPPYK